MSRPAPTSRGRERAVEARARRWGALLGAAALLLAAPQDVAAQPLAPIRSLDVRAPRDDAFAFGERVVLRTSVQPWWATEAIEWTSSLDGALGRGRGLSTDRLRPGVHVITARAVHGGLEGRAVVHVDGWGDGGDFDRMLPLLTRATGERLQAGPSAQDPDAFRQALRRLPHLLLGDPLRVPPGPMDMLLANATTVNATLGHGRLTAGVDASGTLTLLRWPGPAGLDHLDVLGTDYGAPRRGLRDDQGLFVGLRWRDASGAAGTTWLRDAPWSVRSRYAAEGADTVVTTFGHAGLGLEVVQTDAVAATSDVLARRIEVRPLPGSAVAEVRVLVYANPAPCTRRIPYLPYSDTALDLLNDFATVYDPTGDLVLSARPHVPAPRALLEVARAELQGGGPGLAAAAGALARDLDGRLGPGVVLALGGDAPSDAVQVGVAGAAERAPARAQDPWLDAQDGDLGGRTFAAGRGACVLARDLDLRAGPASWTVFVAAGASADGPAGARTALIAARARGFAALRGESEQAWGQWLGRATLPNLPPTFAGGRGRAVLLRGLIATRTAHDAGSGALVASVAGQLPYAFDWPRDGAFLNRVLDLAGYPEMVEQHNAFYTRVQRDSGLFAGTYAMNYASDGTPGGPWLLEIDNAGCAGWTLGDHARYVRDPARRRAYLQQVMPTIARTANFFTRWRDPFSKLPLPANEDDTPELSQGLQGSASGVMALSAAVDAGRAVGWDPGEVDGWERRRRELVDAIERRWGKPDRVGPLQLAAGGGRLQSADGRGMAWVAWPADLLDQDPLRLRRHTDALMAEEADFLSLVPGDYLYNAEPLIRAARARRGDPAALAEVERGLRILLEQVPTDTDHYAELYRLEATPGGGRRFTCLNDTPHVWEHALVYLLAWELYGP